MAESRRKVSIQSADITNIEDILNIPDVKTAFQIMKEFGIDRKGIKNKDEAMKRIVDHWKQLNVDGTGELKLDFSEILNYSEEHGQILTEKCLKVENFCRKLPENHQADLNNVFPGMYEQLNKMKGKFKSVECPILFVGETNSGKSSLINLLLGHDLLPTGALATTRNICEIKSSRQNENLKVAIFHRRCEQNSRRHAPEVFDLTDPTKLENFRELIMEYDNDTGETNYEKVEIFWPHIYTETGLVMIDTPGIGENRNVLRLLEHYANKVHGFVYVINSASAGGVLKRVRQFLKTISSVSDEEFSSEAAMFVFNKWDTVPDKDRSEILSTTLSQLRTVFSNIQKDQIYYISSTEAMQVLQHGGEPGDRTAVIEGIIKFIPACLRNGFNSNYRFLSQIIKRSLFSLKIAKQMNSKGLEEKRTMKDRLRDQICNLEANAKQAILNLRLQLKNEARLLQLRVKGFLSSPWLDNVEWDPVDCPKEGNWKNVEMDAIDNIKLKFQLHIDKWEKSESISKSIKEKIRGQIKQDFEFMEDRMKELGGQMLGGDVQTVNNFHTSVRRPTKSVKQLFASFSKEKRTFDRKSLGNVICLAGHLDSSSRAVKSLFKSYKSENGQRVMQTASKMFIESIKSKNLNDYIHLFLVQFESSINEMENRIPHVLQADRKLFENLSLDLSTSQESLQNLYPHVIVECQEIQGELDMFYIKKLRQENSRFRDITWTCNDVIGCGSFADVFIAKVKNDDEESVDVAIKVYKNPIQLSNISDILLEARTLKDLSHVNIVKYYGSTLREHKREDRTFLKWALIMEYCSCTLFEKVINSEFQNPGKCEPSNQTWRNGTDAVVKYASQISEGLSHLHSKSLVHRDLKLANILITDEDIVKLSDVGMTKAEEDIVASAVGSPIYMAPEVMQNNVCYDRKADIYSFAILIWEMWYGYDASVYMKTLMRSSVEASVLKDGLRPPISINTRPPDKLKKTIQECWDIDPEKRHEAKSLAVFFESFFDDVNNLCTNVQMLSC